MEYQTEIIPEHFYLKGQKPHPAMCNHHTGVQHMESAGVELATKDEESSIDEYWTQIHKIVNEEGKVKYKHLFVLAKWRSRVRIFNK